MRRALPARHHYKETVSDRVTEGSNYGFIPADRRIAVETEGAITARPALALTSQVGCVCVCVWEECAYRPAVPEAISLPKVISPSNYNGSPLTMAAVERQSRRHNPPRPLSWSFQFLPCTLAVNIKRGEANISRHRAQEKICQSLLLSQWKVLPPHTNH